MNERQELFQNLIQVICNPTITQNIRNDAEQQLHQLFSYNNLTYQDLLYFLNSNNENLLFFTGNTSIFLHILISLSLSYIKVKD